jgi:hypothetical protein
MSQTESRKQTPLFKRDNIVIDVVEDDLRENVDKMHALPTVEEIENLEESKVFAYTDDNAEGHQVKKRLNNDQSESVLEDNKKGIKISIKKEKIPQHFKTKADVGIDTNLLKRYQSFKEFLWIFTILLVVIVGMSNFLSIFSKKNFEYVYSLGKNLFESDDITQYTTTNTDDKISTHTIIHEQPEENIDISPTITEKDIIIETVDQESVPTIQSEHPAESTPPTDLLKDRPLKSRPLNSTSQLVKYVKIKIQYWYDRFLQYISRFIFWVL